MTFQVQVYPPPAKIWKELEKLIHNFVSGNKATPTKVFLLWSKELLYTPRLDGGLGVHDPSVSLACLAARRVGLLMTEVDQLKRELMARVEDLPLVAITRDEVAKERLVFNRAIMMGVTAPVGGQKHAEQLWDWALGDLVKQQQDDNWELKSMAELKEQLGGKGPARLALKAFAAAPGEWREVLLPPCTNSAGWGSVAEAALPRIPILENGEVVSQKRMREHWEGKRA
ncbi:unnamed protein product [Closterium sp. NIES-53]